MEPGLHSHWQFALSGAAAGLNMWRPLVEILILAVAIYHALRFIRGTRGAPVVTGFLVLLLAFVVVSYFLQLRVLQYLFGAFSTFFIS